MKKPSRIIAILLAALLSLSALTGCNADAATTTNTAVAATVTAETIKTAYDTEDLDAAWKLSDSTVITLKGTTASISGTGADVSGSTVSITNAGTYVLSGTLTNGQIAINAGKEDLVRLVLNGASVTNADGPAIQGIQAEKVILTLAAGTNNVMTDGSTYTLAAGEDEPNAAIYTKDDLSINGSGMLTVNGLYNHGIFTKDDLVIADGALNITAVNDGLKGKDSVAVKDGNLTIKAGSDGIQASNEEETDKGWITVDGGTVTITAGDDGIHAESALTVNDGTVSIIKSVEGLEGKVITVTGGNVDITATDDALNATSGTAEANSSGPQTAESSVYIRISGGAVVIDSQGDGIDSNGSLYLEGGTVMVNGPTNNGNGPLDYNGECTLTGGTLAIAGSSGMAQSPSSSSTQASITVIYSSLQKAGTPATLTDSSGKVLLSFTPEKDYQSIVFSSSALKTGSTYTLHTGGTLSVPAERGITADGTLSGAKKLTDVTPTGSVTRISDDGSAITANTGGHGPDGQMRPEGAAPGTRPAKPDTTETVTP